LTKADLMNFVVFDLETTGLNQELDEIIEIGAVLYKEGKEISRFNTFVKPARPVPTFIKQLTNITDSQLNSGVRVKEAIIEFSKFAKDSTLVGHNVLFDAGFMNTAFSATALPALTNSLCDTAEISRIYLPFIKDHKLGTVAEFFKITSSGAHRAIHDAETTAIVYISLLEFIFDHVPLSLNNKIVELSHHANSKTDSFTIIQRLADIQRKYALVKNNSTELEKYFQSINYVGHKAEIRNELSLREIFADGGMFMQKFPDYEIREGQIEMAENVLNTLEKEEMLMVEAGTGVGKSLAYLIPAIMFTNLRNYRAIISTNTKNLQEQLFYKDLPAIEEYTHLSFEAVLLKGRDNYLCEKKWLEITFDIETKLSSYEAAELTKLVIWKAYTKTGDIEENSSFSRSKNSFLWKKICADRHFCSGKKCPHFNNCYLMQLRKRSESANIVIVNHSLMISDMINEMTTLGKYDYLIIDEAHNLPAIASSYLGISVGYNDIMIIINQMYNSRGNFLSGIIIHLKAAVTKSTFESKLKEQMLSKIEEILTEIPDFQSKMQERFKEVGSIVREKGSYGKIRIKSYLDYPFLQRLIKEIDSELNSFYGKLVRIRDLLDRIERSYFPDLEKQIENIDGLCQGFIELSIKTSVLVEPDFINNAYWLSASEYDEEKIPSGIINFAPLDIKDIFRKCLYDNTKSIIFTSATLAIRGVFKFFSSRLGLDLIKDKKVHELVVPSPFDYNKQVRVVAASFLPLPTDKKFFPFQSVSIIRQLIKSIKKGTLVLFTSYADLNSVYESISEDCYGDNVLLLAQGKGTSRNSMLNEFKSDGAAVLLGTNSFWEGIDVKGESLSLLIIYKLPFLVPGDPIVEAYLNKLEAEGKDSFNYYMLPNALLRFKQGFGRLIRSKKDRGAVIILDNRIDRKEYGHYFKKTLPTNTVSASSEMQLFNLIEQWFKNPTFFIDSN